MFPLNLELRALDRRNVIHREIFGPRNVLRRGSVPKWYCPEPTTRSQSPDDFDSEPEKEIQSLCPLEPAANRAQILRKNSLHGYRTKSLNDLYYPFNSWEDRPEMWVAENLAITENGLDRSKSRQICEMCRSITAETMASENGHDHMLLRYIYKSKLTCRMCDFLHSQFLGKLDNYTADRYRIRLSLDASSDQWSEDHFKASTGDREFSIATVQVMNLRPWEPPENSKTRSYYDMSRNPESFLQLPGSSPKSVHSRPVYCFTEEHDPARQQGLRWIRDIGANTASRRSIEIAKGWLSKCLAKGDAMFGRRVLPLRSGVMVATRRSQIASDPFKPSEPDAMSDLDMSSEPDVPSESDVRLKPGIRLEPLRQIFPQDYPARLIHICEGNSEKVAIHLIDAQERGYEYAALSYCWGLQDSERSRKWQLTMANDGPHHKNINMNNLPQTIIDSITIAWKLRITYIWIDALCIVQDSASDWAQEAAKMASIYRNSLITIAVSAGASAEQGCFNSGSQRSTELDEFRGLITVKANLSTGQESCLYFLDPGANVPDMYDKEILKAPLSKRAWTYQEHVLPRRILYCTSKQFLWECMHCLLSEDNFPQYQSARPYPILDFDYTLGQDKISAFWYLGAVQQYSRRQLTFEKDKLIAISALAKATYHNRQSDYIAGLWKDSLTLGLMWCRSSHGHKSKTFPCPSWSWASQNSEVSYSIAGEALEHTMRRQKRYSDDDEDQEEKYLTWPASRIVSVDWTPDQNNAFGNVSDAHIDLCTLLGTGTVASRYLRNPTGFDQEFSQAILIPYTSKSGKAEWFYAVAMLDDAGVVGAHVAIALLREPASPEPTFLLLDPPDLNAGTFQRVGLAQIVPHWQGFHHSEDWIQVTKTWARKTIRLT